MMKLFWVSCYCSTSTFEDLFKRLVNKPEVSIQHYLDLLLKGTNINGVKNYTLCDRQIPKKSGKLFWKSYKEMLENGDVFVYLPFLTIPILGHLIRFFSVFFKLIGYSLRGEKPEVIICDVMRFWVSTAALFYGKIFKVKVIGFAADIPQMYLHQYNGRKSLIYKLQRGFYSSITTHYDAYIELSEYMDHCINPHKRPMIVIEGIVDGQPNEEQNTKELMGVQNNKTVMLYTGGLYEKYGVKLLVDSVAIRKDSAIELWLLGKGDLEEYIHNINCDSIVFYGYCPHEQVVDMQRKADFLINPRFSYEDYTKYSFPSKIMEYLVSGTPVISTKLKGIPEEYFNYIIPIKDESIEGLTAVYDSILNMDKKELILLGQKGRKFVLQNKNNIVQSKRLIDWLNEQIKV